MKETCKGHWNVQELVAAGSYELLHHASEGEGEVVPGTWRGLTHRAQKIRSSNSSVVFKTAAQCGKGGCNLCPLATSEILPMPPTGWIRGSPGGGEVSSPGHREAQCMHVEGPSENSQHLQQTPFQQVTFTKNFCYFWPKAPWLTCSHLHASGKADLISARNKASATPGSPCATCGAQLLCGFHK